MLPGSVWPQAIACCVAAGAMLVANAERPARIGWLRTQIIKAMSERSRLTFHFVARAALFILSFNLRSRPEVRILDSPRLVLALALWHMRRHAPARRGAGAVTAGDSNCVNATGTVT